MVLYNVAGFADNDILARRRSVRGPGTLKYLANTDTVIMSTGDGLYLLRKKDGRIDSREIYRGQHYSFCLSRRDTVWVIGEKTLTDFSLRKNLPVHTRTLEIDLKGEVLDMFEMNGSLYILQPYQIIVHGLKNSSDQILSLRNLKLKALPENTCFLPLDSRELILGTDIGLFVFYLYDSKILPTYIDTEPLSTRICALEKDISKHIWVATESSLYSLNKAENTIKSYTRFEGLHWPEHGPIKVSKSPGGFICFAGESEAVTFHPDLLDFNRPPPAIKIKELSLLTRKSSQHMSMLEADTIRVNNRYTLMQFTCNLLDYWDPHNNKYEYSLVKSGKPDYWVDLGTHNSFTISRLRPGIYSLKVRGLNSSNTWTEEPRELVIDVVAPIWRTKIAILVYAIVVFLMFYFSIFFTTRQLRKLNREYREREQIARKVEQQKEELTQKNKNITDSLNYAKRIQMALLPSQKLFSKFFSESFILHIPKDIVSGDFYWINEVDGRIYFAAVDCTGHGVPGAFMSIIGFELFRRITEQEKKKRPAEILNSLSQGFESIFRDIENITLRDGMDVAFCAIDPKMKVLEFAGAFNPLYLIRDNTISEIKGDRFSVGLNQSDEGFPGQEFQDHVIQLREGDVIYIFTDGYADQFGGPEGKKYKYRRFRHLLLALHQLPMERQVEFLRRSIMDWKGDIDQVDDILVMGIRVHQRE